MTKRATLWSLAALTVISFAIAIPLNNWNPNANFYLVIARAWELLVGALIALTVGGKPVKFANQTLSLTGLAMILVATVALDERAIFPGPAALLPVGGAILVILFAAPGTVAYRLLSARIMVGIGLISYSLYLWHQPLLAFARIHAREEPGQAVFAAAILASFVLAFLTWKFVEQPFRNRAKVSTRAVLVSAIGATGILLGIGGLFHITDGFPKRLYGEGHHSANDHISYNSRVFAFRSDAFEENGKLNVLVTGNSFARDFSNVLIERYGDSRFNLIYRDDAWDCLGQSDNPHLPALLERAHIVIIASGKAAASCISADISSVEGRGGEIFYVGSKNFGYNLNWVMQVPREELNSVFNRPTQEWAASERALRASIPSKNYLSIYDAIRIGNEVPVTDDWGNLISADTIHLTSAGARFVAAKLLPGSRLEAEIERPAA